jgi:predicted Zn-dependent protease
MSKQSGSNSYIKFYYPIGSIAVLPIPYLCGGKNPEGKQQREAAYNRASCSFDFRSATWQSSRVTELQPPDSHHLTAAKGWLEFQAFDDAARELDLIRSELRDHPAVLEVRWALAANAGHWQEALAISVLLTRLMPDKPEGWIYQGSALAELNRHEDAHAILLEGHQRFPQDEILAYDLGYVCCALGRADEAVDWIRKAIAMAGEEMRKRALEDPDMEPIHVEQRAGNAAQIVLNLGRRGFALPRHFSIRCSAR